MAFRHTAIRSAKKVEIGTVAIQRMIVFFITVPKPAYPRTSLKLLKLN